MNILMILAWIFGIALALPLIAISVICWLIFLGLAKENLLDKFQDIKSNIPLFNREG